MKVKALKPHFRAAVKADGVLELCIYEEIGFDFWTGGGVTADSVKAQLDQAGSYNSISLRINSPGGDAFEGVAINSLLKAQNKPIAVFVDGIAASAASIIAMAGDEITMAPGAMMMIHDAWSMCIGNDEDMRKMADTLERVSASIAQVYVDRTGKPIDEVSSLMDAETWMSAEECVANGFATAVSKHQDRAAMALASSFKALAKMKRVPDQLRNDNMGGEEDNANGCNCECAACTGDDCANCSNQDCQDENCEDCPMQGDDTQAESDLSLYEAQVALIEKRKV